MADYVKAAWIPNNNFFPDAGKKSFIILHGTAGGSSAQEIANYFQGTEGTTNPVSSHYIVGQDGTVVQCVAEKDGAYGNGVVNNPNWLGNPNYYTISIEHVKASTDNSDALTSAQQDASFALIKDICIRNGIGMHDADNNTGITGHFSIDPINRAHCPGTFDWNALWAYLNGGTIPMATIGLTDPTVASHFTGGPDVWQCKDNGFFIGYSILKFYQSFGGDALCGLTYLGMPKSNEIGDPANPGVVIQKFERGSVRYDPSHLLDNPPGSGPVYTIHVEQDPRYITLQSQISTLQGEIDKLQALLASSTLGQIGTLAKQIDDDVALIMKLSTPQ